jgi:hypothetical protein
LAGSISWVLPAVVVISEITSDVGGIAAAIAIGAFIGQARPSALRASTEKRRRHTAAGGFSGMAVMIGLILYSQIRW